METKLTEVSLEQILHAREERVEKQKNILNRFKHPIVSFTMNIAGPIKTSPLIERSFYEGIRLLKESLPQECIIYEYTDIQITGCEAIFSVKYEPPKLKDICTSIEENHSIGRLFDMDVIDTDGTKLGRKNPRSCLICGIPGRACAAGRLHSVSELQLKTNEIMQYYFFCIDKEYISTLALNSLLDEVYTTPKPGLVDCRNNGSHTDMDINTFIKSSYALKPYFEECFLVGKSTAHLLPSQAFLILRKYGIEAEKTMYNATGGINTHKGAIYSMGILCASIGRLWKAEKPISSTLDICQESADLVKEAVEKDFEQIDSSTAGGRLYLEYGLGGIRKEAQSGFESVLKVGLPHYKRLRAKNLNANDAGAITLLHLILNVKDTNLYNRGGLEGAKYAVKITSELLTNFPQPNKEQIEALDDAFIKRNLSPGGCADLLAITYFLYSIDEQKKDR